MEESLKPLQLVKDNLITEYKNYTEGQPMLYPDGINAQKVLPALLQLQHDKEAVYGQSWRKYGQASAFLNVARKWDRIDNIMEGVMSEGVTALFSERSSTAQETFMDTVVDLANYSLLWVGYLSQEYPEMWLKFLDSNNLVKKDLNGV